MENKNILVFLAEGFEETEAIATIDVLRRGGLNVRTVSVTESKTVTGAHRIPVIADEVISHSDLDNAYALILPGGMPGTLNLQACAQLTEKVASFAKAGKLIAAICAAPMIFGHLGLLEGKEAVCYPGFEEHLKGATVPVDRKTVVAGNIVTSVGVISVLEFGLTLVELIAGKQTRADVENQLKY